MRSDRWWQAVAGRAGQDAAAAALATVQPRPDQPSIHARPHRGPPSPLKVPPGLQHT